MDEVDEGDPRIRRSRRVVRQAALEQLAAAGYGGFTVDAVARRSGVARSTIYRHWSTKAELIIDALETLDVRPAPVAEPPGERPRERIGRLMEHLAEVFDGTLLTACVPALIEGAERDPALRRLHHRFNARRRQALVDAIAAGIDAGEIDAEVDVELASLALAGAIIYRRLMTATPLRPDAVPGLVTTVLGPVPER